MPGRFKVLQQVQELERPGSKRVRMPGSFSDFPALNLFTDRKVSGERIGNGRIPERVIFYSDSNIKLRRLPPITDV